MDDVFKIYIHRLTEGRTEKIRETLDPTFMDISEADLVFDSPIEVSGEAEMASTTLVIRLNVDTEIAVPCSICNNLTRVKISVRDYCHTEDLSDIKGGIFEYQNVLREAILLEVPLTAECSGNCPEREKLAIFFSSRKKKEDDEYHPFENL